MIKKMVVLVFFLLSCVNAQWPTNIVPRLIFYARPAVIPAEPTALQHYLRYITFAWFETWATCNDTAVGPLFLGTLRRTNQATNCTLINKNTAYAYAAYRILSQPLLSQFWQANFDAMMAEFGLDPNNTSTDTSTPIGLGNFIGNAVKDFMNNDGMNANGELSKDPSQGTAWGVPYSDYTHYSPRQTTYELTDPNHFQPTLENRIGANGPFQGAARFFGNSGLNVVQNYATPQMRFTKPFAFRSPKSMMNDFPQVTAKYGGNIARHNAYLQQAAAVLNQSAHLTDQDKLEAEFFESKNLAFGSPLPFLAANTVGTISGQQPWTVDDFVVWEFLINAAVWDAVILGWSVKRQRDTVRPVTAIRFLYKNAMVSAWGGPGKGTQTISGAGWQPYLRTMAHSEYPSGSSCMCVAFAEANRQWFGHDNFGFAFPVTKGSSSVEPGFVPAVNMTLGPYATFTQYAQVCGQSRLKAGVHFQQSINDALEHCGQVATKGATLWRKYLAGTVTEPVDVNDRSQYHAPASSLALNSNDDEDEED